MHIQVPSERIEHKNRGSTTATHIPDAGRSRNGIHCVMSNGQRPDPFEERTGTGIPGAPAPASAAPGAATYVGAAQPQYSAAPAPYAGTPSPYGSGYNVGYTGAYNAYNGGGYSYNGGNYYGAARAGFARPPGGAGMLGGVQEAMARFARVSALVEDALRSLHLLFDALFGLGVSASAFSREIAVLLQAKTGPFAFIARALRRLMRLWRVICLLIMSPIAGRYSPVAVALRVLGLVPPGEPAIMLEGEGDAWPERNGEEEAFRGAFDPSNL